MAARDDSAAAGTSSNASQSSTIPTASAPVDAEPGSPTTPQPPTQAQPQPSSKSEAASASSTSIPKTLPASFVPEAHTYQMTPHAMFVQTHPLSAEQEQQQLEHQRITREKIKRQIAYYFTARNLNKDRFLLANMVHPDMLTPCGLLATFPAIRNLCSHFPYLLDAISQVESLRFDPSTSMVQPVHYKLLRNPLVVLLPDPIQLLTQDAIREHLTALGWTLGPIIRDAGNFWLIQMPSLKAVTAILAEPMVTLGDFKGSVTANLIPDLIQSATKDVPAMPDGRALPYPSHMGKPPEMSILPSLYMHNYAAMMAQYQQQQQQDQRMQSKQRTRRPDPKSRGPQNYATSSSGKRAQPKAQSKGNRATQGAPSSTSNSSSSKPATSNQANQGSKRNKGSVKAAQALPKPESFPPLSGGNAVTKPQADSPEAGPKLADIVARSPSASKSPPRGGGHHPPESPARRGGNRAGRGRSAPTLAIATPESLSATQTEASEGASERSGGGTTPVLSQPSSTSSSRPDLSTEPAATDDDGKPTPKSSSPAAEEEDAWHTVAKPSHSRSRDVSTDKRVKNDKGDWHRRDHSNSRNGQGGKAKDRQPQHRRTRSSGATAAFSQPDKARGRAPDAPWGKASSSSTKATPNGGDARSQAKPTAGAWGKAKTDSKPTFAQLLQED
eukprot:m.231628 g.231628  ORF g.231628 m.231628 type:complete len:670 (-) comp17368_c0_seq1:2353-4362(-)